LIIEGVSSPKKVTFRSFISDLWKRRVFQILGLYLIASWILKLAVSAVVTRNLYSPYLVDLTWVILLSLIPTVFFLTFYHGHRSSGKWTRPEIIGLPANLILSVILAFLLFEGKDLGATTTVVSVLNEKGEKIERTFLKGEFRKKVLVFFFDNKSSDTALNWVQYALPNLMEYDISQDMFIEANSAINYFTRFREAGNNSGLDVPFMLKKKIATDVYMNTFMAGTFNFSQGKYSISTQLFNTQNGKLLSERSFTGENILNIADEITLTLKTDLGIPEQHIEETPDLPLSEIYTSSSRALEYFTKGYVKIILDNDWNDGVKLAEIAIAEDPGFIAAHLTLAQFYLNNNQSEKATTSLQLVMANLYKLPERQQFFTKYFHYLIQQEADKAHAICKMWTDLYPDDIQAHSVLAESYRKRNELANTIQEYKKIIALDPEQFNILRVIGSLYEQTAIYDSARYYYTSYANKFPDDFRAYRELGNLDVKLADFINARKNFEKALLLEPGNVSLKILLADLDLRDGKFDDAYNIYQEALSSSRSAKDSASVYFEMDRYYSLKGEMIKSLDTYLQGMNSFARYNAPKNILINSTFNIDKYVLAGRDEDALKLLKKIELEFQPPLDKVASFGYLFYFIELGDANEAEKYLPGAMDIITGFGEEMLMANIYYAKARIAEIHQDYNQALESYMQYSKMQPNSYPAFQWIARCYRELGNLDKARENIFIALKNHPFDPENNYEASMIYLKTKDKQKAKEHIDIALKIWINADPDYEPYRKALLTSSQIDLI
jgi:tetratricopeptide (TPR) repeat protein